MLGAGVWTADCCAGVGRAVGAARAGWCQVLPAECLMVLGFSLLAPLTNLHHLINLILAGAAAGPPG